jgi:glycine hydroxymethyltransferase
LVTSGVRIGTPALATRGFGAEQFTEVADVIASVLMPNPDIEALAARIAKLAADFPLYSGLENW